MSFSLHRLERCLELEPGRQRHNSTTEHLCCAAGDLFPSSNSPSSTPATEQLPLPAIPTATILNNPISHDSLQTDHPHAGTPRGNESCTMAGCRNTEYFFPGEFLKGRCPGNRDEQSPATHLGSRVDFFLFCRQGKRHFKKFLGAHKGPQERNKAQEWQLPVSRFNW